MASYMAASQAYERERLQTNGVNPTPAAQAPTDWSDKYRGVSPPPSPPHIYRRNTPYLSQISGAKSIRSYCLTAAHNTPSHPCATATNYVNTKIHTGHRRRPRPAAGPLRLPNRPHLLRPPDRLRTRLHAPDSDLVELALVTGVSQHPASKTTAQGWRGDGGGQRREGDAQVPPEREDVQGHHDGYAAGGAGEVFQWGVCDGE